MLKRGFQFAPGYRLQEFLGRGQFGQVWRATAPGGAALAAKFIDLSDGQGPKEYEGIKRVKQIRHANLMPITAIWLLDAQGHVIAEAPDEAIETIDLSVAEPKGQSAVYGPEVEPSWLVVAMLLGGKSLQQRLRECVDEGLPGIPPKELISYMGESAKGLDFLNTPQHDLGDGPIAIPHSDVKPANIVLIGSSAVVCDFGLSRILTRNQVTATSAAGTPAYMAPEAISGKPSRTSDQYSLAVTYYQLRTGSLPVNDGSLKLGLVPEAEQEVLKKATELEWEKRFETNVDMVDALREALRAEGHTKPGFEPASSAMGAGFAEAPTQAVQGDPTATIDLWEVLDAHRQGKSGSGFAEQSTQEEDFLKETDDPIGDALPDLKDSPADATAAKTNPSLQRPRLNWKGNSVSASTDQHADTSAVEHVGPLPRAEKRGLFMGSVVEQRDEVDCTVFAPPRAKVDSVVMIQVFVHCPSLDGQAIEAAKNADPNAEWRGSTSLGTELKRGSQLAFNLRIPRLDVALPEQSIVWLGRTSSVQYSVEIPNDLKRMGDVHGTVYVTQDSIPIGQITFIMCVESEALEQIEKRPTGKATRYSKAFISYARRDTAEVTRRVQMLEAVGIRYFQDVFSLKPGDPWLPKIHEAIRNSDVLLLFWSQAAKSSSWVEKEWRYALENKGDQFIVPVVIEGPPIPEPPVELQHLHFGSSIGNFLSASVWRRFRRWIVRLIPGRLF